LAAADQRSAQLATIDQPVVIRVDGSKPRGEGFWELVWFEESTAVLIQPLEQLIRRVCRLGRLA